MNCLLSLTTFAAICLSVMGCQDDGSGGDAQSPIEYAMHNNAALFGSRIAPIYIAAKDGTTILNATMFHDTELDDLCMFTEIPAYGLICRPNNIAQRGWYFSDPACKARVFLHPGCKTLPKFGNWYEKHAPDECGNEQDAGRWYRLGNPLPNNQPIYVIDGNGTLCLQESNQLQPGDVILPVIEEINADIFLSADNIEASQ